VPDWLRRVYPHAVLLGAWCLILAYGYPGQLTPDTLDHFEQARTGFYTDGHPPIVPALFWLCDSLVKGPLLVLILQTTTFLLGLYVLLKRAFSRERAAWMALGIFVFPPVLAPMAVVWKDCIMAGLLLSAIAGLLSTRRPLRIVALLAITIVTALRYNAFGATFPLVMLLFEWRPGIARWKRYGIALSAWLATAMAALLLNAALTDRQMHLWHSSLALFDIVGTYANVDDTVPDAELEARFAGTEVQVHKNVHAAMRKIYNPRDFIPIITDPEDALWTMPIYGETPAPEPQREAIGRAWWDTVTEFPGAYLIHRAKVFGSALAIGAKPAGAVPKRETKYPDYARERGLLVEWLPAQIYATAGLTWLWRHTPLFTPWIYLLIACGLLVVARKQRDVFAFLASGILMEFTLYPLAASRDYRYSHWLVVMTVLAAAMLIRRARNPDASLLPPSTP